MNYQRIYDALIAGAIRRYGRPVNHTRTQQRPIEYAVLHHIIPVSWWATEEQNTRAIRNDYAHEANKPDNLCWLSPREHWIAHLCLALTYGGPEWIAVEKMAMGVNDAAKGIRPNSRLIEKAIINGREANRRISAERVAGDPEWSTRHITDDVVARRAETLRQRWKTDEALREGASERGYKNFHSPEASKARRETLRSDRYRDLKREETTRTWQDEEVRARRIEGLRRTRSTEESRAKTSAATKARWANGSLTASKDARPIIATNMTTGEETHYRSLVDAVKEGFNSGNIFTVCEGKKISAGGFYWRWADEDPSIQAARIAGARKARTIVGTPVSGEGELVYLTGSTEITARGFGCSNITACLKGRGKSHKGYTWRYATPEELAEREA